jgi:hypothetical protein
VDSNRRGGRELGSILHYYTDISTKSVEMVFVAPNGLGTQLTGREDPHSLLHLGFSPLMAEKVLRAMTEVSEAF